MCVLQSDGIWSLLQVLRVYANHYIHIGRVLQYWMHKSGVPGGVSEQEKEEYIEALNSLAADCVKLGLEVSYQVVSRAIHDSSDLPTFDRLSQRIGELERCIDAELSSRLFFFIPSRRSQYMFYFDIEKEGEDHHVGEQIYIFREVIKDFPSVIYDLKEAGKCFATGCFTACVFHLMRVMEVGLRTLAKSLNNPDLDPRRNPGWESILKKCDDELRKPQKDRSPEWQRSPVFFSEATANLRTVKDAWRNPTMHVEVHYDEDLAREVWSSVRVFMRHLAKELHE